MTEPASLHDLARFACIIAVADTRKTSDCLVFTPNEMAAVLKHINVLEARLVRAHPCAHPCTQPAPPPAEADAAGQREGGEESERRNEHG